MELKISHCFIAVHDHPEALAFYRDVLGLEVRSDTKDEGMPCVTVGPKAQPDINIVLERATANPNTPPQDKQVMSQLLAKGMLRAVIFATDGCAASAIGSTGSTSSRWMSRRLLGARTCRPGT